MPGTWLIRLSFRHAALSSLASFRRLRTLREIYSGGYTWSWHRNSFLITLLPAPSWGLAGTSGRTSLQCHTAARLQRFSADKCAAQGSASFLPQALLPALKIVVNNILVFFNLWCIIVSLLSFKNSELYLQIFYYGK